jgi:hypothetical protein
VKRNGRSLFKVFAHNLFWITNKIRNDALFPAVTLLNSKFKRVLKMVCDTRVYSLFFFNLFPSVIVKNTAFLKMDVFPSSGEGVGDTSYLGPLEWANPHHWTAYVNITAAV